MPETVQSQAAILETQKQTKWIKMHQSQVNVCFERGPLRWLTEQKNPNFLWSLQNTQCDTMNLAITSLKERSQNSLLWHWLKEKFFIQGAKSCSQSLAYLIIRRGSTPVSTVLRKIGQVFHNKHIFNNNSRTFQVEIWKMDWTNVFFFQFPGSRQKPGKGSFRKLKPKKIPGGASGLP